MIGKINIPTVEVTLVRIYTLERTDNVPLILSYLR
jgi:hypothetical protein